MFKYLYNTYKTYKAKLNKKDLMIAVVITLVIMGIIVNSTALCIYFFDIPINITLAAIAVPGVFILRFTIFIITARILINRRATLKQSPR